MTKYFQILLPLLFIFTACKSNQDAYNATYQRLKEKSKIETQAKTAMSVPVEVVSLDSSNIHPSEIFNVILGEEKNISGYNIVVKSFINKTNARGYYLRMIEDKYPAVLVQNEELMFRIIVGSSLTDEEAENMLVKLKKTFPEAWILVHL